MTRTREARNSGPRWHPSGEFFGFTSTRNNGRQLYLMWPAGGEALQVTDVSGGIDSWGWSHDGSSLAWLAGDGAGRQIWVTDGEGDGIARPLTDHPTPISSFEWRENRPELLFLAPDAWDEADHRRRDEGFAARPIQRGLVFDDFVELYPSHLWRIGADGVQAHRVTQGDLIVRSFEDSPRGERIALVVGPLDPHADNRPNEIYLTDPETGQMERLTENDVSESIVGFSPDGSRLAISAPRDFRGPGVNDIFVRAVEGGDWTPVTASYDSEVLSPAWSADGESLRFVGRDGVNRNLYEASIHDPDVRRLSDVTGVISLADGGDPEAAVIGFSTPDAPSDLYAASWEEVGDEARWNRLTNANPWVEDVHLARTETLRWTSGDGTEIEGLVVYPLDHDPTRTYPLITEIHGGPAAAFENSFLPTSSAPHRAYGHFLAARDYALFLPNYRGSSNYGQEFRTEIAGDYWTRATEDIHAGIDHLVDEGLAHPDSLGFMGWSAGGHWSNWMLVTTDRFKAIATGAGVTNWISLYAQTDNQASREFYLGRDPSFGAANKPWDDFDHWWDESPLKYITNASTPTLIHFPQADQRIPMPQGQELHLALKGLGVPTEFMVYPDELHALRDPRNQLVKLMADLGWFEMWIRGAERWFDWEEVLEVADRIEAELSPTPASVADSDSNGR
jgi:dipeptidyl aminopeptidase/acylaminoacyl peptidase